MAASKKAIENANRLRYVRALERFYKSIVAYLSNSESLSKEAYAKKVDNALKLYNRVEEVVLYKGDLQDLQKLVKKMIAYKESSETIENIKEELLYSANQLDKSKNARRYKKDKHSKSKYADWE
ncbi:hypothetical protein MNB_SM-6-289 [hydrothermal vent metagenome]|uniref:Uncharacterized protein n=1 Tax=hydrothermal vent metagenome TaxID=652676 RepID=A0A1W1CVU7_9ZZZZ